MNPSTGEAEAGGALSSRPAWFTQWSSGQPGLHRKMLFQNKPKYLTRERMGQQGKEGEVRTWAWPGNTMLKGHMLMVDEVTVGSPTESR